MSFQRAIVATAVAGVMLVLSAAAQQEVLFSETFTGPYQSTPTGWIKVNTPEGNFWYLRDGAYCSGNGDLVRAQDKRTYSVVAAGAQAGWRDYEVVADAHMIQRNGAILLVGRWQDARNHYEGVYQTDNGRVTVQIVRVADGRSEVLAQRTSAQDPSLPDLANGFSPADGRRFRLAFRGDRIIFSIDQREVLQATDDAIAAGTAGVGQSENLVFFDNFRVMGTPTAVAAAPGGEVTRVYRLVVAEGWTREQARDYQRNLEERGFVPVILRETSPGRFDVLTGTFLSRDEAVRQGDRLLAEGEIIEYGVIQIEGAAQARRELAEAAELPEAYTIQVAVTRDRREAEAEQRHLLEDLDYFPVTILDTGEAYAITVGNFSDRAEAERLLPEFDEQGFPFAQVAQVTRQELIEATTVPETTMGQEVLAQLTPEERQRIEQVVAQQRALSRGANTAEEIRALQELMSQLRMDYSGLRERVQSLQEQAEERERQRRQINALVDQAYAEIDARNWDSAEQLIASIFALEPNNATGLLLQSRVRAARDSVAGLAPDEVIARRLATAAELEQQGDLEGALAELRAAQSEFPAVGRIGEERRRVQNELERQRLQREQEAARRLEEANAQRQAETTKMLMIITGVGVAAVFLLLFLIFRLMGQEKALRAQMSTLATRAGSAALAGAIATPAPHRRETTTEVTAFGEGALMPDPLAVGAGGAAEAIATPVIAVAGGGGGIGLDPAEANQPVSALAAMVLETIGAGAEPEEAPRGALGKLQRSATPPRAASRTPVPQEKAPEKPKPASRVSIDFGFGEETPSAPEPPASAEEPPRIMEIASLDDEEPLTPRAGSPEKRPAPKEPVVADPFATGPGETAPGEAPPLDLDFDLGLSEPKAAAAPGASAPSARPEADDVTQPLGADILDEAFTELEAAPTPAAAPQAPPEPQKDDRTIYVQTYSPAEAGRQPAAWKGSYDFASLTVVTENTLPNSPACLRFEKRSGAGSAFYTCRFPDARGVVGIEFDLRCDHKNQYLLGLYFEHNENFRQSVHTVIHRTDETVTLRLQGKSAPYTFGTWVHVKFRIDLRTGMVDGQVDNRPVAVNVPLLSMAEQTLPPSINTISIRDTLASEGVFYLDNIRVYRA